MRILFFSHYTELYGANRSLLNLLEGFQKINANIEPIIFCPQQGDLTKKLENLGIQYVIFPFHYAVYVVNSFSWIKSIWRQFQNSVNFNKLKKIVEELKPDYIYTNSSVLHISAHIAYSLNIPHIWHIREYGLAHYRMRFDLGNRNFEKWLNRASMVISISNVIKNDILYNIKSPIYTIYNGILFKKDFNHLAKPKKNNQLVFVIAGTLYKAKRQHLAIKAFAKLQEKHPNSKLMIIGDGRTKYKQTLFQLVKEANLNNKVIFHGYVDHPIDLFRQADVGLTCSQFEGMGRVTVEYMACKLPVIGFNSAGTSELIEHKKNGLLFTDEKELLNAMEYFAANRQQIELMGSNAYNFALQNFSIESYTLNVYNVLSNRS